MKKQLLSLVLLGISLLLMMCKNDDESPTIITPSTSSEPYFSHAEKIDFTSEGGEKEIVFTTNKSWKVSSPMAWCSLSPTSGESGENIRLKIQTQPNTTYDERNATIRIQAEDSVCTVVVTQKQKDALLVSVAKNEFGVEGGQLDVEVQANIDYTVQIAEDCKSWIKMLEIPATKGLNQNVKSFTIETSEEYDKREGSIIFSRGTLSETVKVYQAGSAIIVLTPNRYEVSAKGDVIKIELKSNFDFTVNYDAEWINTSQTRALSTHTLTYNISENNTGEDRTATLTFNDKNSDRQEIVTIFQPKKEISAQIITNINDSHFITINGTDGSSADLYGTKNEEGYLLSLNQMIVKDANQQETSFILDAQMRPTHINVYNGVSFNLEWISQNEVILTGYDANSGIQVNTLVDRTRPFDETQTIFTRSLSKATSRSNPSSIRNGKLSLKLRPKPYGGATTRAEISQGGIILNVIQCDSPYSATNWINVYNHTTGNFLTRLVPRETISEGKYLYVCPESVFPTFALTDLVDPIANVIDGICSINDAIGMANGGPLICPAISFALMSTGIGAAAAPEFFVACEVTLVALQLVCSWNPGDIVRKLNNVEFLKKEYNMAPIRLVPYVDALPNDVMGTSIVLDPGQSSASLTVDLEGHPMIRNFTLNPSNPAAGQGYIALADLFCIPVNSSITIGIIGTDGYSDFITTTSQTTTAFTAELWVPGAETGVYDVCTVTIKTPTGETFTRQAALVFGN